MKVKGTRDKSKPCEFAQNNVNKKIGQCQVAGAEKFKCELNYKKKQFRQFVNGVIMV